ncbi:hypothetical protein IQ250_19840 [Pseudanabaenaceae cyanobacterium LEGE 13415]|nr:hypothetical protein [Pseudanabaenaceae cyanobacterium LEGE 13415]
MNVQVLKIEPGNNADSWDVWLALPNQQVSFHFVRKAIAIGKYQGWSVTSELRFYQTFQFNQHITHQVHQLLRQVIQGDSTEFPISVGQFYTPEAAKAEMTRRLENKR